MTAASIEAGIDRGIPVIEAGIDRGIRGGAASPRLQPSTYGEDELEVMLAHGARSVRH